MGRAGRILLLVIRALRCRVGVQASVLAPGREGWRLDIVRKQVFLMRTKRWKLKFGNFKIILAIFYLLTYKF